MIDETESLEDSVVEDETEIPEPIPVRLEIYTRHDGDHRPRAALYELDEDGKITGKPLRVIGLKENAFTEVNVLSGQELRISEGDV